MRHRQSRPISFAIFAALMCGCLAAAPNAVTRGTAAAATQSLSAVEIKKIDDLIAQQGRDIAISPLITDIVGLTQNDQTITCRAFGAVDPDTNDIRHIYLLPADKGYLIDYFHANIVEVYWTDKNLALIAALSGVRGQKPGPVTFQQAQFGFGNELAWWAKFADTR
jgi:hypothetical protein